MGNEFCAHTRALAESFRKTRPRELHIGVESDFHPAKKAHAAFAVQDLGKLRATLQAHNIKVTGDDSLSARAVSTPRTPSANASSSSKPAPDLLDGARGRDYTACSTASSLFFD